MEYLTTKAVARWTPVIMDKMTRGLASDGSLTKHQLMRRYGCHSPTVTINALYELLDQNTIEYTYDRKLTLT